MSTSNEPTFSIESRSPEQTLRLGEALGRHLFAGAVVGLSGELGSGKTLLTKGIALGLGITEPEAVVSPTFIIFRMHAGRLPLYHVDAYRLSNADAFHDLDLEPQLGGDGVCVVEWSEKVAAALPAHRLEISLEHRAPESRQIRFTPIGDRYRAALAELQSDTP